MEKAILFSAVEGHVIKAGQPLAGATLIREWEFDEDRIKGRDETVADSQGHFTFPAVTHAYRQPRFFAQEKVIAQLIRVTSGKNDWRVWESVKQNIEPGTEASTFTNRVAPSDKPLIVTIDLDSTVEERGSVFGHTFFEKVP